MQNVVLGGIPITLDFNPERYKNELIAYLGYDLDTTTINRLSENNNRVIIYHLGDELGIKDRSGYESSVLVLRSYYFEHIIDDRNPRVNWVPSGYKSGIGPRDSSMLKPAHQRPFPAGFCGWTSNPNSFDNERMSFVKAARRCGTNLFLKEATQFAGGFDIGLYATVLENSVFGPCPAGNSPETIRLYDVLESGAIPVTLNHAFLHIANPCQAPPFPILQTWDELPEFLSKATELMKVNPQHFSDMQRDTISWWTNIKDRSRDLIINHIS